MGDKARVDGSKLSIKISQLRGHGLLNADELDKSDPLVVMNARCSDTVVTTPGRTNTLEPDWSDCEFELKVQRRFTTQEQLEHWHVLLSTFDQDVLSYDDVLGHGVLSLKKAAHSTKPESFIVYLSSAGTPAGTLSGKVEICT